MSERMFDTVVVGAGNAALCAAIAAAEGGARVLVLERAPEQQRGGNSFFTAGTVRFPYHGLDDVRELIPDLADAEVENIEVGAYTEADFFADLGRLTEYQSDPEMAGLLIHRAFPTMKWMRENGIRFTLCTGRQAHKTGGKFRFWGGLVVEFVGGGRGLVDMLVDSARRHGVEIWYSARAMKLLTDEHGRIAGIRIKKDGVVTELSASTVVLACGGFEANAEMRARYLGPDWDLARVRGTEYNTGDGISMALEIGAQPYGHWSGCHSVAWDANAPLTGDRKIGDLYQKHSYPVGIMVNKQGKRFVDEGADFRNYTYAKYGKEILKQPERVAFQIFDQKVAPLLREEYKIPQVTKAEGNTLEELAEALGIDAEGFVQTVTEFNAAVQEGEFNLAVLDAKGTKGISPPKSNWALTLDSPPYLGFAVTCGITFTFGGLRVDAGAGVMDSDGVAIPGLYAAGELVGGLFYYNYPGGSGLTSGAVFGRLAGESAAAYAREKLSAVSRS